MYSEGNYSPLFSPQPVSVFLISCPKSPGHLGPSQVGVHWPKCQWGLQTFLNVLFCHVSHAHVLSIFPTLRWHDHFLPSVFTFLNFQVTFFGRIKPRITGFLMNPSLTQAKNVSRCSNVPGQKLWGISVKTTRAINNKDAHQSLQSCRMRRAWDSCLLHPSVTDSPSPHSKGAQWPRTSSHHSWDDTQLLSLLNDPMASALASILTPLTQYLYLHKKGINAKPNSNLWEKAGLVP